MANYQTLIRIAVEHDYHANGICPCLNFIPTNETRKIFENAGLLSKETASGVQIAYDESRLDALRLYAEDEQEPLCFTFKVYSTDRHFRSYSEPFVNGEKPEEKVEQILYFDNRATRGVNTKLSVLESVSNADFKHLDEFKHNRNYKFDAAEKEEPDVDNLKDILSQKDHLLPPEFVLRIFAANKNGPLLDRWLKPEPTVYSIVFKSRKRYWQYYLLGKMAQKDCYVTDVEQKIEFEATSEVSLSDQRVASTFRSRQSIPLSEYYGYRFQLKERNINGDKDIIVINQLPVASMQQVGIVASGTQAGLAAEIYINS